MEVTVLGTGDAFTADRNNTSFLIRNSGVLLIDGPHSLFRILRDFDIDRSTVNDVLLTHIHGDHAAGLETLALWKRYAEKRKIRLYTSRKVFESFREGFFGRFANTFTSDLLGIRSREVEDYLDFVELDEDSPNLIFDDLSVEIRHNWHPVPTLGLRFESEQGTVGISGDTCYDPQLLSLLRQKDEISESRYQKLAGDWLWSADVIYHEASPHGSPHTPAKELLKLPQEIRQKIRLVHTPDGFAENELPLAQEGETAVFSSAGVAFR